MAFLFLLNHIMTEHKNQHYVSQFYLKNFSSDRKTIGTLILSSNKFIENAPIKNQCSKDNFYQDKNYEIALSELEADTSVIFDKIMNKEDLSSKEKFIARAFMLLQETRTKHSAEIVQNGFNLMTNYIESLGVSEEFKPRLESLRVDSSKAIEIMKSLFQTSMNNCADLMLKVIINTTQLPFITCDDPLLTYNKHLERLEYHNYGLCSNGLILLLPISPNHALVLYDSNTYKLGTRKEFYVTVSNKKDIEEICLLTILHANQTIYIKNGSTTHHQLTELTERATKYTQSEKMELESFSSESNRSELIHSYSEHFHIGAQFSFLKELDKAKAIHSLNKRSFCVTDIMRPHCMRILEQEKHLVRQYPLSNEQTFSKKVYSSRD